MSFSSAPKPIRRRGGATLQTADPFDFFKPVRAAITPDFDGYGWSSLYAFKRGDSTAIKGMRLVYGETLSVLEMLAIHHARMAELLEAVKLKRARPVASHVAKPSEAIIGGGELNDVGGA